MTQTRGYNFGAGPATLPESILKEAQAELLDWQGLDMSVMEIGHRTPEFSALMDTAINHVRELLKVPDNYAILFIGSAARTQFAQIPMNLINKNQEAGYVVTGIWSEMALQEAIKISRGYCVASAKNNGFTEAPDTKAWDIHPNSAYIYYTPNETINGLRLAELPDTGTIPLIADMTSCIFSEPVDVSRYGLIFAGAQKNIANAGLTLVIVRKDLLENRDIPVIPTMLDYQTYAQSGSMYATPPVFNCYLANKMFEWIKIHGGVDALYVQNCEKAKFLYDYIDHSGFYTCQIKPANRSLMNVCFRINNEKGKQQELEALFLVKACAKGLYALKGHKMVGGLRASLYNAMPLEGVEALVTFMDDFAREHHW